MKFINYNSFIVLPVWSLALSLICHQSFGAGTVVGNLVQIMGVVETQNQGASRFIVLNENGNVFEGDVLRTGSNAKAKILFKDGTELHLQEKTSIKVDEYVRGEPSLISVFVGSLRAKISKSINGDLKAVIRTKSTAMGVRGTDFQVMVPPGGGSSSLLTYEGKVEMAKLSSGEVGRNLSQTFRENQFAAKTVMVNPGEVALVTKDQSLPSMPVRLSPLQFEILERTTAVPRDLAEQKSIAQSVSALTTANTNTAPMPVGVSAMALAPSAKDVFSKEAFLNSAQENEVKTALDQEAKSQAARPDAQGVSSNVQAAPPAGGAIDVRTGAYLPPPPGSQFDPLTKTFTVPVTAAVALASVSAPGVAGGGSRVAPPQIPPGQIVFPSSMNAPAQRLGESVATAMDRAQTTYGGTEGRMFTAGERQQNVAQAQTNTGQRGEGNRPGNVPYFNAGAPLFPQRDSIYCPPYCDPRYIPGTYQALPERNPHSTVTFRVRGI